MKWLCAAVVFAFGAAAGFALGEDATTNIVDGVDMMVPGFLVGETGSFNALEVWNGGRARCDQVGLGTGANSNAVLVTGAGSYLTNYNLSLGSGGSWNRLTVAHGGAMQTGGSARIGLDTNASFNSLVVSGLGSLWTNAGSLVVGDSGQGNQITVQQGARLATGGTAFLGFSEEAGSNTVTVAGTGSEWLCDDTLYVGFRGSNNALSILDGAQVKASWVILGGAAGAGNELLVAGGTMRLASGRGTIEARRGQFTLESGAVSAAWLRAVGPQSQVVVRSGTLSLSNALVNNETVFVIGDSNRPAWLNLLGGTNQAVNGLLVAPLATLGGGGVVEGPVHVSIWRAFPGPIRATSPSATKWFLAAPCGWSWRRDISPPRRMCSG
jgi:T5SS/PEP-CTERM-associated repeat protein